MVFILFARLVHKAASSVLLDLLFQIVFEVIVDFIAESIVVFFSNHFSQTFVCYNLMEHRFCNVLDIRIIGEDNYNLAGCRVVETLAPAHTRLSLGIVVCQLFSISHNANGSVEFLRHSFSMAAFGFG